MDCKKVMKILKKMGYYEVKKTNSNDHKKFTNDEGIVTIVPYKGSRQLAHGTICAICRQIGVSKKEFMRYS